MSAQNNSDAPLRLIAHDQADLEVMAACFQDAVLQVGDMGHMATMRRFALVANRLRWERVHTGSETQTSAERVRCGLHFDDVNQVHARRIRRDRPDEVLSLMTIRFEPDTTNAPGGFVTLVFAGGGEVRLKVDALSAACADLSGPWPARGLPGHDAPETSGHQE
ncbi:MAG: DUF2948 family protein [Parvularculales bacterium]